MNDCDKYDKGGIKDVTIIHEGYIIFFTFEEYDKWKAAKKEIKQAYEKSIKKRKNKNHSLVGVIKIKPSDIDPKYCLAQ